MTLDLYATGDAHQRDIEQAAAELRRLHEVNADLLIAMQKIAASSADEFGSYYTNRGNIAAARAAIAKAEGGAA